MTESIKVDTRQNIVIPHRLDVVSTGEVAISWGPGDTQNSETYYHRLGYVPMVLAYYNTTQHWTGPIGNFMNPLPSIEKDSNGKITKIIYIDEITSEYVKFAYAREAKVGMGALWMYVKYYILKQRAYGS